MPGHFTDEYPGMKGANLRVVIVLVMILFSIVDVRLISEIKRPASDDRALKSPERRR
jgi:hypothetical protein